jgi:streptomycin 6-kinase
LVVNAQPADGRAVVLKVPTPWTDPMRRTINVLSAADGRGYAKLIHQDEKSGAMLLEQLGAPLSSLRLSVNVQIATLCKTLREAWFKPADPTLFTSGDQKAIELATSIEDTWNKLGKPCSRRVIDKALAYAQLRKEAFDPDSAVLAHGDAHASNLLQTQKGQDDAAFKFVDPEGLFIEPAYDLSAIMRDWGAELLQGDPLDLGRRRCDLVARLTHLDPEPIWQWGFIERVSTGLHLLELGWEAQGKEFLAVAEAWATDRKPVARPNFGIG